MNQLKILIVRDRESSGGGIFNYYESIKPHLSSNVRFLSIGRPHGYYGGGGHLLRFTPIRLMIEWSSLVVSIFVFRPDIVHLNPSLDPECDCRSMKRDAVSAGIAGLLGKRVVSFWRGWNNEWCGAAEMPGGNLGWIGKIFKKSSAQVVLSSRFKEDLVRWGFTMPIHVETTVASDAVINHVSRERMSPSRFRILFLSRIEVAKGVFEMLDAFELLQIANPGRFELVIAGDGPALVDLRREVEDRNISDVLFTGYVSGAGKVRCFSEADAFCFLSYTEGMPNAVLEAMATGLPLVSSDAGGLRDILDDGVTGYVLHHDGSKSFKKRFRAEDVAAKIERLANSPEELQRIGRHNSAYARERFSAGKVAERLEKIYQEAIA